MRFTDSHCHLAMGGAATPADLLDRAREAGVVGFLVPATHAVDAPQVVGIAEANQNVWAAVGFHPHESKDCSDEAFAEIRRLAMSPHVVAIGEIGLDYHYMHSPKETQREVFVRHLALARELDKPVVIHNRESTDDMIDLLSSVEADGVRGVLHSFTESYTTARILIDRGFEISFSGILTFRTAESLRETAVRLPLERILIETDTPFLTPVPHRGKGNEPRFVVHIAKLLAEIRRERLERIAEVTTSNFETLFRVTIQ